jgi:hypothetical protein
MYILSWMGTKSPFSILSSNPTCILYSWVRSSRIKIYTVLPPALEVCEEQCETKTNLKLNTNNETKHTHNTDSMLSSSPFGIPDVLRASRRVVLGLVWSVTSCRGPTSWRVPLDPGKPELAWWATSSLAFERRYGERSDRVARYRPPRSSSRCSG